MTSASNPTVPGSRSTDKRKADIRRKRLSALVVLGAVTLGVLASVMLVWTTISKERIERQQTVRYAAVLSALRDINRAALNAETGQRGYFITLDRRYLASYDYGVDLYPRAVERLKALSRQHGDARIERLAREVEEAGDAKLSELAITVELIEQGNIIAAQQRILSDEGRIEMERLVDSITRLETLERSMQADASAEARRSESLVLPLLALTMVLMAGALGLGFGQAMRAARAEEAAARADEIEEARDRADLLARELNHRVKNLFAVILAIVRMSARGKPEAAPVVDNIAARIHALLTAHDATQGAGADAADTADMGLLVGKVLAPYGEDGNEATITGADVALDAKQATPVGLVLHELATNAVKYGAWSHDDGKLSVDWSIDAAGKEEMILLRWVETAPHIQACEGGSTGEGFGSMLMRSAARQLGGEIERTFEDGRMSVEMRIPHMR